MSAKRIEDMSEEEYRKFHTANMDALIERGKGIPALERGRSYVSAEELDIIYSWKLTTEEKWAKVSAIREARAAKRAARRAAQERINTPLSFEQRIVPIDTIRARALGIRID